MSHALKEELKRFVAVVTARKTIGETLGLFDQLKNSTRFSDAAKPMCFGHLISECSRRIPDRYLMDLQIKITQTGAARLVREFHIEEDADLLLRPLVARLLRATATHAEDCTQVFLWLESSGISEGRGPSLGLAIEAGMSEDELDPICDLTQPLYYAGTALANCPPMAVPA